MAKGINHQYVSRKVVSAVISLTSFDCIDGGEIKKDTEEGRREEVKGTGDKEAVFTFPLYLVP